MPSRASPSVPLSGHIVAPSVTTVAHARVELQQEGLHRASGSTAKTSIFHTTKNETFFVRYYLRYSRAGISYLDLVETGDMTSPTQTEGHDRTYPRHCLGAIATYAHRATCVGKPARAAVAPSFRTTCRYCCILGVDRCRRYFWGRAAHLRIRKYSPPSSQSSIASIYV